MTRDDLVNYICTSSGYVDADDVSACQEFVQARDRMIFESALWRDALCMAEIPLDPVNNADHAAGIVLLPNVFGRVVAARTTDNALRVNQIETYLRFDLDKFQELGTPFEFSVLPAIWFNFRGLVGLKFSAQAPDNNVAVRVVWKENGERYQQDLTLNLTANLLAKSAQQFVVSGAGNADANGTYTYQNGYWTNTNAGHGQPVITSDATGLKLYADNTLANLYYQTAVGTNSWTAVNGALPPPAVVYPTDTREIVAAYKGATTMDVLVQPFTNGIIYPSATFNAALPSIPAASTRSPAYQRLRLFAKPNVAVTLRVLGKTKYEGFSYAEQEATVRNSENTLIAFARADLLRRGGENVAANNQMAEAAALLQQLKDQEAVQESFNQRIIPDQGYGPEWGLGPYIRPYF